MKKKNKAALARLYFRKHFRRYIFLITALSFGFAVITVMTSLSGGMTDSVYSAALNHYGGQLLVIGYDKDHRNKMHMDRPDLVSEAASAAGLDPSTALRRINYYKEGLLYFNGTGVRQKNVLGVDWENEIPGLADLDLTAGSLEDLAEPGSILISLRTAGELGCRIGDDLVLKADTLTGQKNTRTFVVRGIFRDSGIFGAYKCFVGLPELQELLRYGGGALSSLGYSFAGGPPAPETEAAFYGELAARLPMAPPIATKEELTFQLDRQSWKGHRYFLIPLGVFVSQVDDLLLAMDLVSYFLYIMISLIILVSIAVTYRLIIRERTPEIGTMRALGMGRAEVVEILLMEALCLFVISLAAGAVLAGAVLEILSLVTWSGIPGFDIFLRKGRLIPSFSPGTVGLNILLLLTITLPAVLVPAFRASRLELPRALAGEH